MQMFSRDSFLRNEVNIDVVSHINKGFLIAQRNLGSLCVKHCEEKQPALNKSFIKSTKDPDLLTGGGNV